MKFCRICGTKIKDDGQICPKCGFHQNASIAQAVEAGEIKEKDWPESFVPKKSLMARRLAAATVAIGSVALLLAGGYFYQHRNASGDNALAAGQEVSVDNAKAEQAQTADMAGK